LGALGVADKCRLEINTLGDPESRAAYRDELVAYFELHLDALSEDSRDRLKRNPLRILDSKDEGDRCLVAEAPLMEAHLNSHSSAFFKRLLRGLDAIGIAYEVNPRLVRGLDYYTHTAFEFVTGELGAQGAVIAGGRYDGLIEAMGGPPTAGTGWAGGIERLAMMIEGVAEAPRPIVVVPIGKAAETRVLPLCRELRRAGLVVELGFRGNLSRRLKAANKLNGRAAVLIGEDELAREVATVRDLDSGAQTEVALAALADHLARYR
jgi:histidyl-tRNA synthetase